MVTWNNIKIAGRQVNLLMMNKIRNLEKKIILDIYKYEKKNRFI